MLKICLRLLIHILPRECGKIHMLAETERGNYIVNYNAKWYRTCDNRQYRWLQKCNVSFEMWSTSDFVCRVSSWKQYLTNAIWWKKKKT